MIVSLAAANVANPIVPGINLPSDYRQNPSPSTVYCHGWHVLDSRLCCATSSFLNAWAACTTKWKEIPESTKRIHAGCDLLATSPQTLQFTLYLTYAPVLHSLRARGNLTCRVQGVRPLFALVGAWSPDSQLPLPAELLLEALDAERQSPELMTLRRFLFPIVVI